MGNYRKENSAFIATCSDRAVANITQTMIVRQGERIKDSTGELYSSMFSLPRQL